MASGHMLEVELTGSTRCGESRKEGEGSQMKTETITRHHPSGQDGSAVHTPPVRLCVYSCIG